MRKNFLLLGLLLALSIIIKRSVLSQQPSETITLNSSITYQTITGWETTTQSGQLECTGFDNYSNHLFDLAVDDLGINRVRLEIKSGSENSQDYFAQYLNSTIDFTAWKAHWYEIINDNSDPNTNNSNGFHYTELDHEIDHIVLPIKQRVEANGEKLYINLTIVDFRNHPSSSSSDVQYYNQPDEYAEFVLAAFQHIDHKYGWYPDAVEIILEPDVAWWRNGTNVGNALVAAATLLEGNGYTPDFIAPSNTDTSSAVTYFDEMIQVTGVLNYLTEISYHRYNNATDDNIKKIANRAVQNNLNTAMLEHIGSGHEDLHTDLKFGRNSSWQQFTLAYCTHDNGAQYYLVDNATSTVTIASRTKFLRQYFKFIRKDAVRIETTSSDNTNPVFDPVAFVNKDGSYVVVVKASSGGSFAIQGLPNATYGIKYTTDSEYDVDLPDMAINSGQTLDANIPADGVLTVYQKSNPTLIAPSSVAISGTNVGFEGAAYQFTAVVNPQNVTQPLTYTWKINGQTKAVHTGGASDSETFTWAKAGTQTILVSVTNDSGSVVTDSHTFQVLTPASKQYLPITLGGLLFHPIRLIY
ncbi:MAG: hypothetical protein GY796_17735 [Chloroflexi bacterium]|nr:hypothetical protein [Chloroflexota bacterium]